MTTKSIPTIRPEQKWIISANIIMSRTIGRALPYILVLSLQHVSLLQSPSNILEKMYKTCTLARWKTWLVQELAGSPNCLTLLCATIVATGRRGCYFQNFLEQELKLLRQSKELSCCHLLFSLLSVVVLCCFLLSWRLREPPTYKKHCTPRLILSLWQNPQAQAIFLEILRDQEHKHKHKANVVSAWTHYLWFKKEENNNQQENRGK